MNFSVIPFVGWVIDFILNFCLAVPFYYCYNAIAPKWLYFLPSELHVVGFWESVALFFTASLIGALIKRIVPSIIKVDNSSTSKTKEEN
ncbi:hypothetical protein LCGC14_2191620 [marine sediment metagenome]|uniref:Uncharacterized protein n=1 Tax=marine sediment metagenome TaxID=412755 RepID=A0A0F9GFA0_9ZZZZ